MMRKIITFIVLAGLALIFANCSGTDHKTEDSRKSTPVLVSVEQAGADAGLSSVELGGTVQSVVTTTISSQAFGRVLSTRYEEGDRVSKNSVMLEINQEQAETGVAQAEAALQEAELALREVVRGSQAAAAGKDMAEANAAVAASTFKRFQALLERESVSPQEYDEVEARNLAAQAAVKQAEQAVLGLEEKQAQVKARIIQAEAGLRRARLNMGYFSVTAPYNGIVVSKLVQTGQLASPGLPLYVIEKADYELHVSVDLAKSRSLEKGQEIPVSFDHLDGALTGKIREVILVADPVSRTVQVKIILPDIPGIYSGIFGRASFQKGDASSVSVPVSALVRRGQLTGVYVVEKDRSARYRLVRIGRKSGSRVAILSGLNEGESVVIDPDQVSEGVSVEIR
ncbi:MAG: efflux RND transporter periplasmic adaptor subunit [Acidobacteriota bacterium]